MVKHIISEPPADAAGLFTSGNPSGIFKDMHLIGHGNYGSVYQATAANGNIVAIKLINLSKGYSGEDWVDVQKEITTLSACKHSNILKLFNTYREKLSVWMVMEYCIGSALDVMDLFRSPFQEREVAMIAKNVLQALAYIHGHGWIHRDIKGGNILLTDNAEVKLGDFGSSSRKSPANTFVGSPYWMAPEVINAMEDGTYTCAVDIWSLGITCIELAESKPPMFDKHAMSALYQIVQRPPPTLSKPEFYSSEFSMFLARCLRKDPAERASADLLLSDALIVKNDDDGIISQLVLRAKSTEVKAEYNAAVGKVIQQAEAMISTQSAVMEASSATPSLATITESSAGGDDESTPPPPPPELLDVLQTPFRREPSDNVDDLDLSVMSMPVTPSAAPLGAEFFSQVPIETSRKVSTELERIRSIRQERANVRLAEERLIHAQLKEIQDLQKDEERIMSALRQRQAADASAFKLLESKEQEQIWKAQEKELERLIAKNAHDSEAYIKSETADEKKFMRGLKDRLQSELDAFQDKMKKGRKHNKEEVRSDLMASGVSKDAIKTKLKDLKEHELVRIAKEEDVFLRQLEIKGGEEVKNFKCLKTPMRHTYLQRLLEEEVTMIKTHSQARVAFRNNKVQLKSDMLRRQLEELQAAQSSLLEKRSLVENEQTLAIEKADNKALTKRQANDLKRHPKLLKQNEQQMKKAFTDTLKSQTKVFKSETKHALESLTKEQQEMTLRSKKQQQDEKFAEQEEKLRLTIQSMNTDQTEQLEARLRVERAALRQEHEVASRQLTEFQAFRSESVADRQVKERSKLAADIGVLAQEARSFEAAEALRCSIEDERVTKFKDTCVKEMETLIETLSQPLEFAN